MDSVQLVQKNVFRKPIQKKSSFFMAVEDINEHNNKVCSKKIQFLDIDAVWWITISRSSPFSRTCFNWKITFNLETREYIWNSNCWTFSVSESTHKILSIFNPIYQHNSSWSHVLRVPYGQNLELNITMTLLLTEGETQTNILQSFYDKASSYKKIINNNKLILRESKYYDFTYIVQDKEFKVHKSILAAASPVFDKVFSSKLEESHTNQCQIEDIDPTIFQHLLNFIYAGELPENFNQEDTSQKLFEAAHYYQMEDLKDLCTQAEHFKLSMVNAEDVYKWSDTYQVEDLKLAAWKIIKWDILEIFWPLEYLPPDAISYFIAKKKENAQLGMEYRTKASEFQKALAEFHNRKK